MEEFKVPTYDQHLFLNEKPLEGNELSLSELYIVPNSLICLKADEPIGGFQICDEEYIKGSVRFCFNSFNNLINILTNL